MPQASLTFNSSTFRITTPAFRAGAAAAAAAGSKTCGAKPHNAANSRFAMSLSTAEEDKENAVPADGVSVASSSPATPYFLNPKELVQKSCPPKSFGQQQPLASLVGALEVDAVGAPLRERLLLAKRKSLEWAPRVSSPLRNSTGGEAGVEAFFRS